MSGDGAAPGRVIAIGASAGGVEALREVLGGLPADLPAAVLVVLHVASGAPSVLPRILDRVCALPVAHACDGEPLRAGHVYVAPPDRHLLVTREGLRLTRGPRENGVRPAVDPLFRSAARRYGPALVGVVLSGTLDDGTVGLQHVKRAGGVAVVQDPADALFDGMPRNAVERVAVDHVVPLRGVAALLAYLASEPVSHPEDIPMSDEQEEERAPQRIDEGARRNEALGGELSGFTCPECHGALWEQRDGNAVRYRCRVGHAYAETSLHEAKGVSIEAALWTAVTALEEHAALTWRMARRAADRGHDGQRQRYESRAHALEERAQVVRELLRTTAFAAPDGGQGGHDGRAVHAADVGAP